MTFKVAISLCPRLCRSDGQRCPWRHKHLTLRKLGDFTWDFVVVKLTFQRYLYGIQSELTDQARRLMGPDLGPIGFKMLSA